MSTDEGEAEEPGTEGSGDEGGAQRAAPGTPVGDPDAEGGDAQGATGASGTDDAADPAGPDGAPLEDGAAHDEVTSDEVEPDEAESDEAGSDEAGSDEAGSDEAGSDEAGSRAPGANGAAAGYVLAGTEDFFVKARGAFEEKAVKGYFPSPESDEIRVDLRNFEGPLDLLLHLVQGKAVDILEIPISDIVRTYLKVLDDMRSLNLDIAGEFLVMASQLAHIKSKMLLPKEDKPGEEEEEDPRAALVRRLLEYQRFQEAAEHLANRDWLGREVFGRPALAKAFDPNELPMPDDPTYGLVEVGSFELIKLLDEILKRTKRKIIHEVHMERLSVGQRINELLDFALGRESFTFTDVVEQFGGLAAGKRNLIVTFLAILEMTKFKLLRVHQAVGEGAIYITSVRENLLAGDNLEIEGYGDETGPGGAAA